MKRIISIALWGALLLGVWQFDNIRDWWWLRTYNPPPEIAELADNITLTEAGRDIFYLANPKVNDKITFNQDCPIGEASKSLILGCFNGGRIFVLKVDRPEIAAVMEVTAAHEMLHAAYTELGRTERNRVNTLLEEFYKTISDDYPNLQNILAEYAKTEPGERLNELHSLLPTQIAELSPELEEYYSRYFINRQKVVSAYLAYEGVFEKLRSQINALKEDIAALKADIEATEAAINSKSNEISATRAQMNARLASGDTAGYNALVPVHNRQVAEYNALVRQYRDFVALHNQKVEQINTLAVEQNQLVDALDSTKFTPL